MVYGIHSYILPEYKFGLLLASIIFVSNEKKVSDELCKKSEIADTIVYYNRLIEQYYLPMTSFRLLFYGTSVKNCSK